MIMRFLLCYFYLVPQIEDLPLCFLSIPCLLLQQKKLWLIIKRFLLHPTLIIQQFMIFARMLFVDDIFFSSIVEFLQSPIHHRRPKLVLGLGWTHPNNRVFLKGSDFSNLEFLGFIIVSCFPPLLLPTQLE